MAELSWVTVSRFWTKVAIGDERKCWPWQAAKTGNGYGNFKVPGYGPTPAHRVAYWIANDHYPEGLLVRHKCDNPTCCNPAHLETGNHVDNGRDMVERGRGYSPPSKGELNGNAKLNAAEVEQIRGFISEGYANTDIAAIYGVSHGTISNIRLGKSWRPVSPAKEGSPP